MRSPTIEVYYVKDCLSYYGDDKFDHVIIRCAPTCQLCIALIMMVHMDDMHKSTVAETIQLLSYDQCLVTRSMF